MPPFFFSFGIQSRCLPLVRHLDPLFRLAFRPIVHFRLAFRAIIHYWHSEPPHCSVWCSEPRLHFDIQSHCSVWHSKSHFFSFGVESHIFISAFKAIVCLQFSIQSHYSLLTFKTTTLFLLALRVASSFWHLEPLFSLVFSVTIVCLVLAFIIIFIPIQAFNATIFL